MKSKAFTLWAKDAGEAFLSPYEGKPHLMVISGVQFVGYFLGQSICLLDPRGRIGWAQAYYMGRRAA
jgi:hypothetical protein